MKGITLCAECAYYSMKKHRCTRGAHIETDPKAPFYDDCPLPDVVPVVHDLVAEEQELRKQIAWLKSCINCKIRNSCPRHCGKVVHDCDHWEYGDPVVHGRWVPLEYDGYADGTPVWDLWECSECGEEHSGDEDSLPDYCSNCGAKMDKEVSADAQM